VEYTSEKRCQYCENWIDNCYFGYDSGDSVYPRACLGTYDEYANQYFEPANYVGDSKYVNVKLLDKLASTEF
jgi:hypothetical protein